MFEFYVSKAGKDHVKVFINGNQLLVRVDSIISVTNTWSNVKVNITNAGYHNFDLNTVEEANIVYQELVKVITE